MKVTLEMVLYVMTSMSVWTPRLVYQIRHVQTSPVPLFVHVILVLMVKCVLMWTNVRSVNTIVQLIQIVKT